MNPWKDFDDIIRCAQITLGGEPMTDIERLLIENAQLRELLRELIDIEGPQPGTADWARKVRAALDGDEGLEKRKAAR
jgi:hypothetical protein